MEDELLDQEDVVSVDLSSAFFGPRTFTVEEFQAFISNFLKKNCNNFHEDWAKDGIECKVLKSSGGGWREGFVRISLSFIPDPPTDSVNPSPTDGNT